MAYAPAGTYGAPAPQAPSWSKGWGGPPAPASYGGGGYGGYGGDAYGGAAYGGYGGKAWDPYAPPSWGGYAPAPGWKGDGKGAPAPAWGKASGAFGKGGPKGRGKGKDMESPAGEKDRLKVFVGALPKAATEEEIEQHFSQHGEVAEVLLKRDTAGLSRGFAFVTFKDEAAVSQLLATYRENTFGGKWIDVRAATMQADDMKGKGRGSSPY